jgi:selenocysteine lyase/cysteine desulfurase
MKLSIILGSTAAINKLVHVLNLKNEQIRNQTVVFISTFEHHSNILPWKETGVEVKFYFLTSFQ